MPGRVRDETTPISYFNRLISGTNHVIIIGGFDLTTLKAAALVAFALL